MGEGETWARAKRRQGVVIIASSSSHVREGVRDEDRAWARRCRPRRPCHVWRVPVSGENEAWGEGQDEGKREGRARGRRFQ